MNERREELEAKVTRLRSEIAVIRGDLVEEVDELDRRRKVAIHRFKHMAITGIGVGISLMIVKSLVGAFMSVMKDLPRKPHS